MPQIKIVILAAGKGERIAALGFGLPKPLIPINGKPMVSYLTDAIVESGVDEMPVIVTAPDNVDRFCEALGEDRFRYAVQEDQLGTGHAVMCAKDAFADADHVMVLYGDHPLLTKETIARLADEHRNSGATMTMMTVKFPDFDGWRQWFVNFGRIVRDASGKIARIVEKKDATEEQLAVTEVNPGYMVFERKWLVENVHKLTNENAQKEYYLTDLVGLAFSQNERIHTLVVDNAIEGIGINTPEQYKAAVEALTPPE